MQYCDLLKKVADKFSSITCMGMDPVLERIPLSEKSVYSTIVYFYESILESLNRNQVYPSAVKPNYAFFAQYGIEGIEALVSCISLYSNAGLPVILDVKRGDIGSTAAAYSREAFNFFKADAVTLSPYMGYDSIEPFATSYPEKGLYILNKTSNKSSGDIQDIDVNGNPLYLSVSRNIIKWHSPGIGAVVGATYPEQLEKISRLYIDSGKEIPLLIPGIGSQGGSIEEVCGVLSHYSDFRIHRINSSSAINYAHEKDSDSHFSDAAARALKRLNTSIKRSLKV